MFNKFKLLFTSFLLLVISTIGSTQNIHFCFTVVVDGDGEGATVTVLLNNEGGSAENIAGYTIRFYYDDAKTTYTTNSEDFDPTVNNLGWSSYQKTVTMGSGTEITGYDSFVEMQVFDDRNGAPGTNVIGGTQHDIIAFHFDHILPVNDPYGYLAQSSEGLSAMKYLDKQANSYDIVRTGTCTAAQPLPVELITFRANNDEMHAYLEWKTASEKNSSHFDVEYSPDGNSWQKAGEVKAAGNSLEELNYTFQHLEAYRLSGSDGNMYYRLKMVDIDGKYEYSEVRQVVFSEQAPSVEVFPNPVADLLNIQTNGLDKNGYEIKIWDTIGRTVIYRQVGAPESASTKLDISHLAQGAYLIQVSDNHFSWTETVIVE